LALPKQDENILQEIVDLNGNCLNAQRCAGCPFRSMCLPEFLIPTPPTQEERKNMAMKVLTHNALLESEEELDIKKEYTWPSRK
jgi:hypothetical protein